MKNSLILSLLLAIPSWAKYPGVTTIQASAPASFASLHKDKVCCREPPPVPAIKGVFANFPSSSAERAVAIARRLSESRRWIAERERRRFGQFPTLSLLSSSSSSFLFYSLPSPLVPRQTRPAPLFAILVTCFLRVSVSSSCPLVSLNGVTSGT